MNAIAFERVGIEEIEAENSAKIAAFMLQDSEKLPHDEILELATSVIQQRNYYANNTIASAFILLANIATNQGDLVKAFQFASDGMMLTSLDRQIQLDLMLKIADGYYAQAKYANVKRVAEQAIKLSDKISLIKERLIALSYKAMAHALLAEHQKALATLRKIEMLLSQNKQFAEHIQLLEILANAYSFQGEYLTAVSMYEKLINLRFKHAKTENIDQIYTSLANAYRQLKMYDDAYNAYWAAVDFANRKNAPIRVGYAELGLGQVLLKQEKYQESYTRLKTAQSIFEGQTLLQPYVDTLIALAKSATGINKNEEAFTLLKRAELTSNNLSLTEEQIELYLLLADMYQEKNDYSTAFAMQKRYISEHQRITPVAESKNAFSESGNHFNQDSRLLAMKLTEQSALRSSYSNKLAEQRQLITSLYTLLTLSALVILLMWLQFRRNMRLSHYKELEKSKRFLTSPFQTKELYQFHFKKARKYNYPISIGYLAIKNWTELTFHFNKKTVSEVCDTIEAILLEYTQEFDHVGIINNGEYLLLCPHQNNEELAAKLQHISSALKVRFFANLGEFSVKLNYAFETPNAQDIEPYIFLSRLSESVHREQTTNE